jgi:hydrogenase expression/formation protein HypC
MCLALPARVVELLPGDQARIDLGGVKKAVSMALVPEAQVGDYVIVHVGHAIGLVDPEEAERTLALFAEMDEALQAEVKAANAQADVASPLSLTPSGGGPGEARTRGQA